MVHNLRSSQETLRADVVSFSSAMAAMGGAHHWEQERSHAMSPKGIFRIPVILKETWLKGSWSLQDVVKILWMASPN